MNDFEYYVTKEEINWEMANEKIDSIILIQIPNLVFVKDMKVELFSTVFFTLKKIEVLIKLKRYDDSLRLIDRILVLQKNQIDALFLRSKLFYLKGDKLKCLEKLAEAIEIHLNDEKLISFKQKMEDIEIMEQDGIKLFSSKKFQKSFDKFTEIIENMIPNADKINSSFYFQRSNASIGLKKYSTAIQG